MLVSAERVVVAGEPRPDVVIDIAADGRIAAVGDRATLGAPERMLEGCLLSPGVVDAHVDVLERARGHGAPRPEGFLENRRGAYKVATALEAAGLRAVARYQFIEMLRAGITSVGAVLTVHHQPDGQPYRDPSVMADAMALAARDAGVRMCLLRSVRLRGDFERPAQGPERRECEPNVDDAAERVAFSAARVAGYRDARLSCGIAIDSLATVPLDAVIALKTRLAHLPFHVGAALGLAESLTCQTLFGLGPVALLVRAGVVDGCTTLVGVNSLCAGELDLLAHSGGVVCRLPAREPESEVVRALEGAGVTVTLAGAPLAVARSLADVPGGSWLDRITVAGGRALGQRTGRIAPGYWADLIGLELSEADADVLPVRHVMVGGQLVVEDGVHANAAGAAADYATAVARLV